MNPEDLLKSNPSAIAHERTIETDADSLETARRRGLAGSWGAGALVERNEAVLLVREDDRWFLPGGQVNHGETLKEAVKRELHEECGLAVEVGDLLAVSEKTLMDGDERLQFHFATYRGDIDGGRVTDDPGLPDEQIEAVEWHTTLPPDTYDRDLIERLRCLD